MHYYEIIKKPELILLSNVSNLITEPHYTELQQHLSKDTLVNHTRSFYQGRQIDILEHRYNAFTPVHLTTLLLDLGNRTSYSSTDTLPNDDIPVTYRNYRSLNQSFTNRILNATTREFVNSNVGDSPIIFGMDILPSGFVFQQQFNKTVDPANFNLQLGKQYLSENLDSTLSSVVHKYEGYRLHHNLNALDQITMKKLGGDDILMQLLANGAQVTAVNGYIVISSIADSYRMLLPLLQTSIVVDYETYYSAKTILSTYIYGI